MGALSIDHVQLTFDLDKLLDTTRFYGGLIGLLEQKRGDEPNLHFYIGESGQRLDLVPRTPGASLPNWGHLAIEVSNFLGLRQRFLDASVRLNESQPLAGHLRLYVEDPSGNRVEILQRDVYERDGRV